MAEPLKTFFSPALVQRLAGDIARVYPSFPSRAFVRDATTGLETLELPDRGKHIARARSGGTCRPATLTRSTSSFDRSDPNMPPTNSSA